MKLIEIEKQQNISIYNKTILTRIGYLNNKKIRNNFNNEEFKFTVNEEYLAKQELMWYTYNVIALNEQYSNNDYVALFITITLDTQFHKYKKSIYSHIINPKYNESNTVNLSYKILNTFFRDVSKNFRVNRKYKKVTFAKVIEPHKDNFTPHLHSIVWIEKDYAKKFELYLKKQIDKSNEIGRTEIEVLNNVTRASSYILKYMQKNFKEESYKNYYGWRLRHSLRVFTFSKTFINKDIFNKLSFNFSKNSIKDPDIIEDYTNNYYQLISMFTTVTTTIVDKDTGKVKKSTKEASEDDLFQVHIIKEKYKINDINSFKIKYLYHLKYKKDIELNLKKLNLINSFNYFCFNNISIDINLLDDDSYKILLVEFLDTLEDEYRYKYKIIYYKIYKKAPSNCQYDLVYDKKEWEIQTKN